MSTIILWVSRCDADGVGYRARQFAVARLRLAIRSDRCECGSCRAIAGSVVARIIAPAPSRSVVQHHRPSRSRGALVQSARVAGAGPIADRARTNLRRRRLVWRHCRERVCRSLAGAGESVSAGGVGRRLGAGNGAAVAAGRPREVDSRSASKPAIVADIGRDHCVVGNSLHVGGSRFARTNRKASPRRRSRNPRPTANLPRKLQRRHRQDPS